MKLRQSSLRTFVECRRKFYLQNILKLSPQGEATYPRKHRTAHTGTIMHEVLAEYYRGNLDDPDRNEVYDICQAAAWELIWGPEGPKDADPLVMVPLMKDWNQAIEVSAIVTHTYITQHVAPTGIDLQYDVLAVEERMEAEVFEGFSITGMPDLVLHDNLTDEVGILDHKSVAVLDPPRAGDFQLLTYAWMWRKLHDTTPGWAGHNQLKRNKQTARAKPPFYARPVLHVDGHMLDGHNMMLHGMADAILRLEDELLTFPENHRFVALPNMTGDCSWKCSVKDLCDQMHDEDDVWRHTAETYYIKRQDKEEQS